MSKSALPFIILTTLFVLGIVALSTMMDVREIQRNWGKYRCRPDVMFLAGLYGHDTKENFEFCLTNNFNGRASTFITPLYSFLQGFVGILATLLESINSIRITFATIVGSVTQVFSEFAQRFQNLFLKIQMTMIRIRYLFGRIGATITSVLFMGLSGMRAASNFTNTTLFKFIDTFCFDPDTHVDIVSKGLIPIREVKIGDVFQATKDRVTATFAFFSDGQPMVEMPGGILVSTNHYVNYNNEWVMAGEHPLAQKRGDWSGGWERPLICLNTEYHSFPVGAFTFRDYDEANEADEAASNQVLRGLNGNRRAATKQFENYDTCCEAGTKLKMKHGQVLPASEVKLGMELSFGKVVGVVKKECAKRCVLRQGESFTPGTAIWDEASRSWRRASDLVAVELLASPTTFYSFIVSPSASLETASGVVFRDYLEIHSPDTEFEYTEALKALSKGPPASDGGKWAIKTEC